MRIALPGLLLLTVLTTPLHADTQRPSTVNGVSANALTGTSIRVSWNKPWDDVGIRGYNVYRNNHYYKTVSNTNFIDNEVQPSSHYKYAIVAFDDARNFSPLSGEVAVSTAAGNSSQAQAQAQASPPPPAPASQDGDGRPVTPRALYAEVLNGNEVQINWRAASGNTAGYDVYRNGRFIASVDKPEYHDSSLRWGLYYRYSVVAYNANGQHSDKSAKLIVNTAKDKRPTSEPAGSVLTEAPTGIGYAPEGYELVFNDEFRERTLNPHKWNSRYRWGPEWPINSEKQYYVDRINHPDFGHSPFEFTGEHLVINAIRTPEHLKASANWQPFLSGALTTHRKFTMRYGYVEMRAKLPKGKGLWSALWLLHNKDDERRPEIDIVEYIGDKPHNAYATYHYYENNRLKSTKSDPMSGPDYSNSFHTYAVKWEPGVLRWYVDGQERSTHTSENVSWEDMYILVNLAVGGWWPGDPDGSTPFPARFEIDYIRAYRKQ